MLVKFMHIPHISNNGYKSSNLYPNMLILEGDICIINLDDNGKKKIRK